MFVNLIEVNLKFQNHETYSNGPIKKAGKVLGDFQDLKPPGLEEVQDTLTCLISTEKLEAKNY